MKILKLKGWMFAAACSLFFVTACSDSKQNGADDDVHSSGTWDEHLDGERVRDKGRKTNGKEGGSSTSSDQNMSTGAAWPAHDSAFTTSPYDPEKNKNQTVPDGKK